MTEKREIRKFGAITVLIFGLLLGIGLWRDKVSISYLFGFLAFLGLCFLLLPEPLKPVFERWLKIAHVIGTIMTAIMLTLAYYLLITPTALIKRLFGGKPIPISPDKNASTYWVSRHEPVQPKNRFNKRY